MSLTERGERAGEALPPAVHRTYTQALAQAPLAVYEAATDSYRAIPASTKPLILDDALYHSLQRDCALILSALQKSVQALRCSPAGIAPLITHLEGLEREAGFGFHQFPLNLATVRYDLFFAPEGIRLLEINSTIPAMQAYGDMVREAWALAWDQLRPSSRAFQTLASHSSSSALLASLLARSPHPVLHLAIVARSGDSQLAELRHLQRRWEAGGLRVSLLQPGDLQRAADGRLSHAGEAIDLVYRHIFASRLDPQGDFAEACRFSADIPILNPVAAHLEAKAMLALLSEQTADPAIWAEQGGSEAEAAAVQRRLPWTRLLRRGPTLSPEGRQVPDRIDYLAKSDLSSWVFKTNGGYGGHGVIIGADFAKSETQKRIRDLLGCSTPINAKEFLQRLSEGKDLWIVQERVAGRLWDHHYLKGDQLAEGRGHYIDLSIFGPGVAGAVCRFAADPIVNLGRGGGLVPVLLRSEAEAIGLPLAGL